jgi:hypothetical protein
MQQQPLPLNTQLDRVSQHVVRARLFLDLWFYFEAKDTRPKIIETMREYNEFFRFTPHAYLVAYVIYIVGVFDKTKHTISLIHLTHDMQKKGYITGQDAAMVDALMDEAQPIVAKVTKLRHKAIAHKSAHIGYNDVWTLAALKPAQLRDLTDIALKIVHRLLSARGIKEEYFTELPSQAAEAMMKALAGR